MTTSDLRILNKNRNFMNATELFNSFKGINLHEIPAYSSVFHNQVSYKFALKILLVNNNFMTSTIQ